MKRSLFLQSVLLLAIFSISDQAIPALRGQTASGSLFQCKKLTSCNKSTKPNGACSITYSGTACNGSPIQGGAGCGLQTPTCDSNCSCVCFPNGAGFEITSFDTCTGMCSKYNLSCSNENCRNVGPGEILP